MSVKGQSEKKENEGLLVIHSPTCETMRHVDDSIEEKKKKKDRSPYTLTSV